MLYIMVCYCDDYQKLKDRREKEINVNKKSLWDKIFVFKSSQICWKSHSDMNRDI